jgi:hypothetical protein
MPRPLNSAMPRRFQLANLRELHRGWAYLIVIEPFNEAGGSKLGVPVVHVWRIEAVEIG